MANFKSADQLREQAAAREMTPQPIPAIVHILPGWATEALCGARPGPQPDGAVPNCRRCLAKLTGE